MLSVSYNYKKINPQDKKFIQQYLSQKIDRFEKLLSSFNDFSCRLDVKAEAFATKAAYRVDLTLHLPGSTIMAGEDDHTLIEAIDLSVDKIIIQLRKLVNRH